MAKKKERISVKGPMKNPPHVGRMIKNNVIEALELSITDAAEALGVTRPALSKLLNQKSSLTWDMAHKIEKAFGPHADHLMRMQFAYDRAQAEARKSSITVNRVIKAPTPSR